MQCDSSAGSLSRTGLDHSELNGGRITLKDGAGGRGLRAEVGFPAASAEIGSDGTTGSRP